MPMVKFLDSDELQDAPVHAMYTTCPNDDPPDQDVYLRLKDHRGYHFAGVHDERLRFLVGVSIANPQPLQYWRGESDVVFIESEREYEPGKAIWRHARVFSDRDAAKVGS